MHSDHVRLLQATRAGRGCDSLEFSPLASDEPDARTPPRRYQGGGRGPREFFLSILNPLNLVAGEAQAHAAAGFEPHSFLILIHNIAGDASAVL